jgi:hypothetical protein
VHGEVRPLTDSSVNESGPWLQITEAGFEQGLNLRGRVADQHIDFEVEDQLRLGFGDDDHLHDAPRVEVRVAERLDPAGGMPNGQSDWRENSRACPAGASSRKR